MNTLKSHRIRKIALLYSPVLVALLVMLPRLISPQFGLMDDGRTIMTISKAVHGIWDMSIDNFEGRFRPIYWLYFSVVYGLFGSQPFWFFIANTLVFAITVGGLIRIVRRTGGSRLQAWAAGFFFALAGPTIESYYTLSKGEPVQLAGLVISLVFVTSSHNQNGWLRKLVILLATTIAILFSNLAKETTLVILPIACAWFGVGLLNLWLHKDHSGLQARGIYLAASFIASAAFLGMRYFAVPTSLTGGSYTGNYAFSVAGILASIVRWSGWFIRDFLYILPLILVILLWDLRTKSLPQGILILDILIWMGGWMAIYLPWTYTVEYYMLPFSAGLSVLAGLLLGLAFPLLSAYRWPGRVFTGACLVFSALLLFTSVASSASNAGIQLAMDAANSETMDYLAAALPPQSMVVVNIQDPNEYFYESQLNLADIRHRIDIQVYPFAFNDSIPISTLQTGPYYLITPWIENQPLLTVRKGVVESTQNIWNASLEQFYGPNLPLIFSSQRNFRLFNFDLPRLFCPLMQGRNYCSTPIPALDRRVFSYGWKVYKIENP